MNYTPKPKTAQIKQIAKHLFEAEGDPHVATLVAANDAVTIIDWKRQSGDDKHALRFITDHHKGSFIVQSISRELGYAIFSAEHPVTLEEFYEMADDMQKMLPNLRCSYPEPYTYLWNDTLTDLHNAEEKLSWSLKEESKEKLHQIFKTIETRLRASDYQGPPYEENVSSEFDKLGETWKQTSLVHLGKRIHPNVAFWCYGFRLACEQLQERYANDSAR